ncbi:hypothetical protein ZHAS_00016166 [Anopheles sinensis]|uniref:Uncharacterized protein n=1 Tax=Anopheles sinensis TaxID=74873 RepID=A0A084WCV1_ANOSI|nr:hypothetical protein ZHAS_00016166 [Anopheles sinensis]
MVIENPLPPARGMKQFQLWHVLERIVRNERPNRLPLRYFYVSAAFITTGKVSPSTFTWCVGQWKSRTLGSCRKDLANPGVRPDPFISDPGTTPSIRPCEPVKQIKSNATGNRLGGCNREKRVPTCSRLFRRERPGVFLFRHFGNIDTDLCHHRSVINAG